MGTIVFVVKKQHNDTFTVCWTSEEMQMNCDKNGIYTCPLLTRVTMKIWPRVTYLKGTKLFRQHFFLLYFFSYVNRTLIRFCHLINNEMYCTMYVNRENYGSARKTPLW